MALCDQAYSALAQRRFSQYRQSQALVNTGAAQWNTNRNTSAASLFGFTVTFITLFFLFFVLHSGSYSNPQRPCGGPQEAPPHSRDWLIWFKVEAHWDPGSTVIIFSWVFAIGHCWSKKLEYTRIGVSPRMDVTSLFVINPDTCPDSWKYNHHANSFSPNLEVYHTVFTHSPV